jgi:hypothetical protein
MGVGLEVGTDYIFVMYMAIWSYHAVLVGVLDRQPTTGSTRSR